MTPVIMVIVFAAVVSSCLVPLMIINYREDKAFKEIAEKMENIFQENAEAYATQIKEQTKDISEIYKL